MAVLVEGISVIIRVTAVTDRYPGGWAGFRDDCPNQTLCADGELIRVGFMTPQDTRQFVQAHGPGWVLVFALRWLGKARRLMAPDSLHVLHAGGDGEVRDLTPAEAVQLAGSAAELSIAGAPLPDEVLAKARRSAQEALKRRATTRGPSARGPAGLSLLMVCRVLDTNA